MKEIIIPLSRKKITLLFLGAMGFVALCFWLIQVAETQTRFDPQFIKIVSKKVAEKGKCCQEKPPTTDA